MSIVGEVRIGATGLNGKIEEAKTGLRGAQEAQQDVGLALGGIWRKLEETAKLADKAKQDLSTEMGGRVSAAQVHTDAAAEMASSLVLGSSNPDTLSVPSRLGDVGEKLNESQQKISTLADEIADIGLQAAILFGQAQELQSRLMRTEADASGLVEPLVSLGAVETSVEELQARL